jgi:hypothetical protein
MIVAVVLVVVDTIVQHHEDETLSLSEARIGCFHVPLSILTLVSLATLVLFYSFSHVDFCQDVDRQDHYVGCGTIRYH